MSQAKPVVIAARWKRPLRNTTGTHPLGNTPYAHAIWDAATSLTGRRVFRTAAASGLDDAHEETVVNPMTTVDEKLSLRSSYATCAPRSLKARAATDTKIDELEVHVAQARVTPRPSSLRRAPAGVGT